MYCYRNCICFSVKAQTFYSKAQHTAPLPKTENTKNIAVQK